VAKFEQELDRLFTVPLGDFTAARNELAGRLKKEGNAAGAETVRALAKPTAAVWAINQAARGDGAAVRALLKAADALRRAQARALGAKGTTDGLRSAQQAERSAVRSLSETAQQALGGAPSRSVVERIERTLGAAAIDPDARNLLRRGRLTHELEPAGFEALAGLAPAGAVPDELAARRTARDEERRRRAELEQAARDAERRAFTAEAAADRAEQAAMAARRAADDARAEAGEAAAALAEA
jgi:hypothetical protein